MSIFPIKHYNQNVSDWIGPDDVDYDKPLITASVQAARLNEFYQHYFGDYSPWSETFVNHALNQAAPYDLKTEEKGLISLYGNKNKSDRDIGYGVNFRPHTQKWIRDIASNINFTQLETFKYHASQRAITIENTSVRALPTDEVHYYHFKFPGQGYPFDNLQMSALWVGSPVYVISESLDRAWVLVLTNDLVGWVHRSSIAEADEQFIQQWQNAAKKQMAAIIKTKATLVDENNQYVMTTYVGGVFPVFSGTIGMKLMMPVSDINHHAVIKTVITDSDNFALMPLTPTPHHFADLMKTLIGRPYGWGGMNFYNDCSQELKNLFTPFAIWLPRHSSDQLTRGKTVDLSHLPMGKRLSYLKKHGRKFMTLIYNGGHIILYIGNYRLQFSDTKTAMTYQAMWGLSPRPSVRRAVIGQSALFPLLMKYPEDAALISQADKKIFRISYLDDMPKQKGKINFKINKFILRALMFPNLAELLMMSGYVTW
ncbi:MAG TPA: SH3 domain-containing protein [Gammaproteobacteria bacterium]|nr:SH3 domain-containing protein [Gammaproteobacteria bacterium]